MDSKKLNNLYWGVIVIVLYVLGTCSIVVVLHMFLGKEKLENGKGKMFT